MRNKDREEAPIDRQQSRCLMRTARSLGHMPHESCPTPLYNADKGKRTRPWGGVEGEELDHLGSLAIQWPGRDDLDISPLGRDSTALWPRRNTLSSPRPSGSAEARRRTELGAQYYADSGAEGAEVAIVAATTLHAATFVEFSIALERASRCLFGAIMAPPCKRIPATKAPAYLSKRLCSYAGAPRSSERGTFLRTVVSDLSRPINRDDGGSTTFGGGARICVAKDLSCIASPRWMGAPPRRVAALAAR